VSDAPGGAQYEQRDGPAQRADDDAGGRRSQSGGTTVAQYLSSLRSDSRAGVDGR